MTRLSATGSMALACSVLHSLLLNFHDFLKLSCSLDVVERIMSSNTGKRSSGDLCGDLAVPSTFQELLGTLPSTQPVGHIWGIAHPSMLLTSTVSPSAADSGSFLPVVPLSGDAGRPRPLWWHERLRTGPFGSLSYRFFQNF